MKKYFVFSDVHGCYTPLIQGLKAKGFDINNPEHILISCGDMFDRGDEVKELIDFIKSLPNERRILIRGNHEHLLIDMINKGYAATYDVVNGTLNTILQLTNSTEEEFYSDPQKVILKARACGIEDWILSKEWVNYAEMDKYVFVHSFVPVLYWDGSAAAKIDYYDGNVDELTYNPDWRFAHHEEWKKCSWGNPLEFYQAGLFNEDKYIVTGHWHASNLHRILGENATNDTVFYKKFIGLDTNTFISDKINVLVLNENDMEGD